MKQLIVVVLLISALCAQTVQLEITAQCSNIVNPEYGLVAQIWNPLDSGEIRILDEVDVSGVSTDAGVLEWGIGISNLEQPGCVAAPMQILNASNQQPIMTQVRASKFPCVEAYVNTNVVNAKQCFGNVCKLTQPITLSPGSGVTVYTALFPQIYGTWHGWATVNFYLH